MAHAFENSKRRLAIPPLEALKSPQFSTDLLPSPMHYLFFATDKPGTHALRQSLRPSHREHVRDPSPHPVRIILGGPTLDAAGTMNGTMLVIEAETVEAVEAYLADDPYCRAGLFERLELRAWNWTVGNPAIP